MYFQPSPSKMEPEASALSTSAAPWSISWPAPSALCPTCRGEWVRHVRVHVCVCVCECWYVRCRWVCTARPRTTAGVRPKEWEREGRHEG